MEAKAGIFTENSPHAPFISIPVDEISEA